MAADNKLAVELTGDAGNLFAALAKAGEGITAFTRKGSSDAAGMGQSLEKLGGVFASIGTAVAGLAVVEFMRESVTAAIELGAEIRRLSAYFGISAEQAGELAEGLKRLGSSPDELISMSTKMVRALGKNREEFEKYGIAVTKAGKDGQPELRKQIDIMLDAGTVLNKIEGDTERTAVAVKLFGRAGGEAATYFRRLAYESENARENLKAMGVEIPYEKLAVEGKKAEKSQKDLTQTFSVLKIMVGTELLSSFVDLMQFFSSIAGPAMQGISAIVKGLTSAFWALKAGVEIMVSGITDFYLKTVNMVTGIGKIVGFLLKRDLNGALQAFKETNSEHERIDRETAKIREDIAEGFWNKQEAIWNKPHANAPEGEGGGGKDGHKDKDSALARVQAALERAKAFYEMSGVYELDAHGNILRKKAEADQENRVYTKTMEAAFLADALISFGGTEKDKAKLVKMRYEAERAVVAEDWKGKLARFDAEIKLETKSQEHAIQLAKDKRDAILRYEGGDKGGAEYVKASAEVTALEKKRDDLQRDVAETRSEMKRDSLLAIEDAQIKAIQHGIEMGEIAEVNGLGQMQAVEDRRYSIARTALEKRIALKKLEGDAGLKDATKLEADLAKLDAAAASKRIDTEYKTQSVIKAGWVALFGGIKTELNKSIQGMILGTTNLAGALKNVWGSIKGAFAQMAADQVMIWLGMEQTKTAATQTSALERVAIETWASIKKVAVYIWEGIKYVAIQAWKAAAGAYSAIVGIPVVGPFLAPAAAIVALMAVLKMVSSIASARKGFDIAAGDNPVTQLHEREMVLPAEHADTIRSMRGIYQAIQKSQGRVDHYNANSAAPSKTTNNTSSQGHTFNISGVIGDKRQLGAYLKSVINQHTLTFGSAI